jgi:hypothetical protein
LLPGLASAEGAIGGTDGAELIQGTARYQVAVDAAQTNAKVFGAVGAFERQILPLLSDPKRGNTSAFAFELSVVKNVVRALGNCSLGQRLTGCPDGLVIHNVTVSAGNLAINYPISKHVGIFYTSAFVAAYSSPDQMDVRDAIAPFYPVMGYAFGPVSFFGKNAYNKFTGGVLKGTGADAVLGLSVRTPYVTGFGGYTASQGLFGDFTVSDLDAFASAVFGEEFSQLSYLKVGLRDFDYLNNSELARKVGRLNLFGRRLVYNVPSAQGALRPGLATPITSGHVEQTSIAGRFDLYFSYRTRPRTELGEARVGARFGNVLLSGGVVNLPDLWMFGARGGYKPALALRYKSDADPQDPPSVVSVEGSVLLNDPELLTVFPYAYNAVSFKLSFGLHEKPGN